MASEQETNKISIVRIGERLKEAREKKALTIAEAQKQTRIHSTVLTALEEGRCDEMLTPTYVKSFLKKYASYLGLDSKEISDEYAILHGDRAARAAPAARFEAKEPPDLSGFFHAFKKILTAIITMALIAFLGIKTIAFLKNIKLPFMRKGMVGRAQRPIPEKRPASKDIPRKADAATSKIARPESQKTVIEKNTPLQLTIKAKQRCLVQVKRDGTLLFKRVLEKGSVESFTAVDSFILYIAKAEALELTLNGRSLGSPGKGVIKNLEITRKGIKIK